MALLDNLDFQLEQAGLLDRRANLKNDFQKLKSYLETSGMLTAYLQELLNNVERHVDKDKCESAV